MAEEDKSFEEVSVKNSNKKKKEAKPKKAVKPQETEVDTDNQLFLDMLGREIIVIMSADQLNILGQTFRPIFCGKVTQVTNGFITLNPVIIKMSIAPFFKFPTPLSFPLENITYFFPFECGNPFPIT